MFAILALHVKLNGPVLDGRLLKRKAPSKLSGHALSGTMCATFFWPELEILAWAGELPDT